MPGMDGLTVLQGVRSLDPRQPVIMLTGAGTAEAEQQARALGVTEFVEEEFSLHLLGGISESPTQQYRPFDVAGASVAREAAMIS